MVENQPEKKFDGPSVLLGFVAGIAVTLVVLVGFGIL